MPSVPTATSRSDPRAAFIEGSVKAPTTAPIPIAPRSRGVLVDGRGDVLAEGAVVLELQKQLPMLVEMDIGRCRLTAGNSQAMQ